MQSKGYQKTQEDGRGYLRDCRSPGELREGRGCEEEAGSKNKS